MILKQTTKYLFDSCVFMGYLRNQQTPRDIMSQASFLSSSIYFSIITEMELWVGIRGKQKEADYIKLLRPFNRCFLNVTVARRAAEVRKNFELMPPGQRVPQLPDCILAATAEYYSLTVVTNNSNDFKLFTNISCEFY